MRVIFVSQTYRPSHDAISQLLTDLAEELARQGHEVIAVTPAMSYMTGEALARRELLDGVDVIRVPLPLGGKKTNWHRAAGYASFLALSMPLVVRLAGAASVVFYLSTPPFAGWSARLVRGRSCLIAQDVYPDVPIAMGYLQGRWPQTLSRLADRAVLSGFDRIVAIGERMRERFIAKGVPPERIAVIENWSLSEPRTVSPRRDNPLLVELGLADRFVVQYSGNMGIVHDMAPIIEAAVALRDDANIAFLVIGDGHRRIEIEQAIATHRLRNVTLLPYQPAERLPISLAAADVALVSLRPELEGLVVPSKLYGILAVGMPVIFIGDDDGEVARTLRRGSCGVTVQRGDQLVTAIRALRDDAPRRAGMAAGARAIFESDFRRSVGIGRYQRLIEELGSR